MLPYAYRNAAGAPNKSFGKLLTNKHHLRMSSYYYHLFLFLFRIIIVAMITIFFLALSLI